MATGGSTTQRKRQSKAGRSTQTRSQSSSNRKRSGSNSRSTARSSSAKGRRSSSTRSNGSGRLQEARKAVASTAQDAGHAVEGAASKAKTPLLIGGGALAGLAGGVALGARGMRRRKVLGVPLPRRSVLKSSTKDLAKTAKEVGKFGQQVGELTSQVRQTREAMDDAKGHSPIGVALQGLTARRNRD